MAPKMASEEYQELGRRYYKLKQFDKAIDTLSQGIEAFPTVGLYDHRAAAYDKSGDLNNAVKDGREMIKLDKKEIKGYLRTASVLEKMEKFDTALGIYKYGMKNVPVGDKNFKLLQQLHDKLTRKLSPETAIDPFTVLPVELAEMILEFLSFRHMVNCMRVSRGWRDYLSKLPKLWVHLDLSGARRPVPRSFVNKAVKRSENRVSRVTIHRFEHVDMLKNMAKMCKHITELEFISLPHTMSSTLVDIAQAAVGLRSFTLHPELTLQTATKILRDRPDLQQFRLHGVQGSRYNADWTGPYPNLKVFELHMVKSTPAAQLRLEPLLKHVPSLEFLTLSNITGLVLRNSLQTLPHLSTLVLSRATFPLFPLLPPTLQRLNIDYDGSFNLAAASTTLLLSRLPHLTHLALHNLQNLSGATMHDLLDAYVDEEGSQHALSCPTNLHSLSIRSVLCPEPGSSGAPRLFRAHDGLFTRSARVLTPALRTLDIATLPCDDCEIELLVKHETGLESVDVSCTNVTGASIKMLVDGLPGLREIKANNCPRINGRDAFQYAERKGVVVTCQMGEGKGGRKIRYG